MNFFLVKMEHLLLFLCVCVVSLQAMPLDLPKHGQTKQCGVEASLNPLHRTPWLVFIEYFSQSGHKQGTRCAGTLIDDRHIVTAAHCVRSSLYHRLVARLGEYNVTSHQDCVDGLCADPVVTIDIVKVYVHEGYDGSKDDIAVLTLAKDAPYTDFIRPVCLPTGSVEKGMEFHAAGWGESVYTHIYSDVKKNLTLPYISDEDCRSAYWHSHLPGKIICAGGQEGVDTCRGDSGGPLTLYRDRVEIWGVTSSGNVHCGAQGTPGIYTNVQEHLEWVLDKIQK